MTVTEPDPEPVTYTIAESATLLRIGINQTYEAVHRGDIPSIKIGHRRHVPAWFFRKLMRGDARTLTTPSGSEPAGAVKRELV